MKWYQDFPCEMQAAGPDGTMTPTIILTGTCHRRVFHQRKTVHGQCRRWKRPQQKWDRKTIGCKGACKGGGWGLTFIADDWLPTIQAQSWLLIDISREGEAGKEAAGPELQIGTAENLLPNKGMSRHSLMIKNEPWEARLLRVPVMFVLCNLLSIAMRNVKNTKRAKYNVGGRVGELDYCCLFCCFLILMPKNIASSVKLQLHQSQHIQAKVFSVSVSHVAIKGHWICFTVTRIYSSWSSIQ